MFNRKQGEIKQRQAERLQAILNLRQTETEIRQDVVAATAQLPKPAYWLNNYQEEILPDLRKSLSKWKRLPATAGGGGSVTRMLDVRRKLLQAQDGYLDALLAYSQAWLIWEWPSETQRRRWGFIRGLKAPAK